MRQVAFQDVRRRWLAAGGPNTEGVLQWFEPAVNAWFLEDAIARDVGALRFMGTEAGGQWESATGGTSRVSDLNPVARDETFRWDPTWALVAVRDTENGQRVLIDGNKRAKQLWLALAAGVIPRATKVEVMTGDLRPRVVRIAKSVAPLWR